MAGVRKSLISVCLVLMLLLCSCDDVFKANNQPLIEPPVVFEEQDEIKNALNKSVNGQIALEYPKTGNNRSAFLLCDLTGDEVDEVVAFYRPVTEGVQGEVVHINILQNIGKKGWISICDTVGEASSIDRVSVGNFSGKIGIIVGWDKILDKEKTLMCYCLDGKKLSRDFSAPYIEFAVADFWEKNEGHELITVNFSQNEEKPSQINQDASLFIRKENEFRKISSVALDARVTGYKSCQAGFVDKNRTGFFLDGVLDSTTVNTQILTVSGGGTLLNPLLRDGKTDNVHTPALLTQDINGDGVLEVPHPELINGYSEAIESEKLYKTVWKQLNGSTLRESIKMFISSFGIRVTFTEGMDKNLTLKPINASREIVFYEFNKTLMQSGDELFRIMVSEKEGFELSKGYEILKTNDYTVVSVKITDSENTNSLTWGSLYELVEII